MTQYYVSTSGNDINNGTAPDSAHAWATLQHAANTVVAGDTVNVLAGTYAGFLIQSAGTSVAPITWLAQPGVILNAESAQEQATGRSAVICTPGITSVPYGYQIIDGFTVTVTTAIKNGIKLGSNGTAGVWVYGNIVRNCTVNMGGSRTSAITGTGIGIVSSWADGMQVYNNIVMNGNDSGIYMANSSRNYRIYNNIIHDFAENGSHNNGDASAGSPGIQYNATVENNIIYNIGGTSYNGIGVGFDSVQDSVIRNNLIYNVIGKGLSLYTFTGNDGSKRDIVANNTAWTYAETGSGGNPVCNFGDYGDTFSIYNNIFISSSTGASTINLNGGGQQVGTHSDYNLVGNVSNGNNLFGDGGSLSLADWIFYTGFDTHSVVVTNNSALFVNSSAADYHLSATSQARGAGTSTDAPSTDLEGNPRPSDGVYDVGAYQHVAAVTQSLPIRLTNNTWLRTASVPSFYGVVPISFSIFVKIESYTSYVDDSMSRLLAFNWTHSNLTLHNNLAGRIAMHSGSTNISDNSLVSSSLTIGTAYHFAFVIDNGSQKLYVNGALVGSRTYSGTEGALNDTASYPFECGCDDIMTIQIQEPTIWSGYALTQADVLNIRNGTSPGTISPGNIKWRVPFSGVNGATVTVGDPGLQDKSGNGYNITSIYRYGTSTPPVVAPVYVGAPLVYVAPAKVSTAVVTPTRTGIVLYFTDLNGTKTSVTAVTANPQLTTQSLNGGVAFTLPNVLWESVNQNANWVYYPLTSGAIGASDTPTLTISTDGWITTAVGSVAVMAGQSVDNANRITLLPTFVDSTKSMQVGYNLGYYPLYYSTVPMYANLARQLSDWYGTVSDWNQDQYGNIISLGSNTTLNALISTPPDDGVGDNKKIYNMPATGTWTLMWDGAGTDPVSGNPILNFDAGGQTGEVITETFRSIAASGFTQTNNKLQYSIVQDQAYYWSPWLRLIVRYAPFSNLRIYPPGVATDGSQKFHPQFLQHLSNVRCLRFMTTVDSAAPSQGGAVVDYSDYNSAQNLSYGRITSYFQGTVTTVAPYADTENYFGNQPSALITFSQPHGLKDGVYVRFLIAGPNGDNSFPLANGSTGFLTSNPTYGDAILMVRLQANPNQIATPMVPGEVGRTTLTTTYNTPGSWRAYNNWYAGLPPTEAVDLCNQVGAHLWWSMSYSATDACITSLCQMISQNLNPGLKLYLEYSNECWNGFYPGYIYVESNSRINGMAHFDWYTKRTGQIHALAATVFTNAGRSGDLFRVFGAQTVFASGTTSPIVNYAYANNIPIDGIAIAPYFNQGLGSEWPSVTILDSLSNEQYMDIADLSIMEQQGDRFYIPSHYAYITPLFPNAKVVSYEGGPDWGIAATNLTGANRIRKSHIWARHPRMRWIMLYLMQVIQDAGCTLFNDFMVSSVDETAKGDNWNAYYTWNMLPGLGDGTDGLYDNRLDFENQPQLVSVIGGAINHWNSLVPSLITPPVTQVNLSTYFNRIGIYTNGSVFASNAGVDAGGSALSSTLLDSVQTWNGNPFTIGAVGANNVIYGTGQTINLPPGNYRTLQFLGLGVMGAQLNQSFNVTYSDLSVTGFSQSLSDWASPQGLANEYTAVTMPYRLLRTGALDNATYYIYGYSFNLNINKTLTSITLPNDQNVILLGITLLTTPFIPPGSILGAIHSMTTYFTRRRR